MRSWSTRCQVRLRSTIESKTVGFHCDAREDRISLLLSGHTRARARESDDYSVGVCVCLNTRLGIYSVENKVNDRWKFIGAQVDCVLTIGA